MESYPFLDKIRTLLPKGEKLGWLCGQIEKSERWFYTVEIERLEVAILEKISSVLNFNFMEDYNHWRNEKNLDPLFIASEPLVPYQRAVKKITIDFRISSTLDTAEKNSAKMLLEMRISAEKYGYELELL